MSKFGTNLSRAPVLQHCTFFLADRCSGTEMADKCDVMFQYLVPLTVMPIL